MKKKQKRRFNFRKTFFILFFLFLFISSLKIMLTVPIKNIYIYNNEMLSDQTIIEIAKLENYPSTLKNLSFIIKNRLEKNIFIEEVNVFKKKGVEVHIEVKENYPLFINKPQKKTILFNGLEIEDEYPLPTLLNVIPDVKYKLFLEKMRLLNKDTLNRISEIEYTPNEVENERFLLYMNDGNYVYLTLDKFSNINNYLSIVKNFDNKKGILYLDYGNHFTIIEDKEKSN